MKLASIVELSYLGLCLECFLFGCYSGVFAMLWQYHASKEEFTGNTKWLNIIFYALCVLYVLSVVNIAIDVATFGNILSLDDVVLYSLTACQVAVFACCDMMTQSILIHRCWIMWGCNIRVIIIPSTLTFAFLGPLIYLDVADIDYVPLVTWMAAIGSLHIDSNGLPDQTGWGDTLSLIGLSASMTVNALVTGLIVLRVFMVFRQVKGFTWDKKSLGTPSSERKLHSFIFILIESGMALFAIQLIRVVVGGGASVSDGVYNIIVSIHEALNGIVPTLTLLRVSMGLSFHDEPSFVEASVSTSVHFAVYDPNQIPIGMGSIGSLNRPSSPHIEPGDSIPISGDISQERRDDSVGESGDIQMVDR